MENKELPKEAYKIYNYRHTDILFIREKFKALGLWEQDPKLAEMISKFGKYANLPENEIMALLNAEEIKEFLEFKARENEKNETILENFDLIIEIHNRIIKPEYAYAFEDDDLLKRDCLFRVFLPRVRG